MTYSQNAILNEFLMAYCMYFPWELVTEGCFEAELP